MRNGLVFAGQGAIPDGKALVDPQSQEFYAVAKDILGYDLLQLSADQLSLTQYAQPAIYVYNHCLATKLKNVAGCVGLSLGEYNALTMAQGLSFEEGVALVAKRAQLMQGAFEPFTTGMAVCLKTSLEKVESLLKGSEIEVTNVNSHSQIVIGGRQEALQPMMKKLKQEGMRVLPLAVSMVSHMSLLEAIKPQFEAVLEAVVFKTPQLPFINNVEGRLQDKGFATSLAKQLVQPTQLAKGIETLINLGVERILVIGPDRSLLNCVKESCPGMEVVAVFNAKTVGGILQ